MATIGKEPATQPSAPKGRPAAATANTTRPSWINKQRGNIDNIIAELRKVTWPTREETRNLTIVVIGISAVLGAVLATLDALFSVLYRLVNP
jgi:preprotein translocase subunit SecE